MRLHDIQVILSSSNVADRFQSLQQMHGQAAQAQEALNIKAKSELKPHQTQEVKEEQKSPSISDDNRRFRNQPRPGREGGRKPPEEQKNEIKPARHDTGANFDIKA